MAANVYLSFKEHWGQSWELHIRKSVPGTFNEINVMGLEQTGIDSVTEKKISLS